MFKLNLIKLLILINLIILSTASNICAVEPEEFMKNPNDEKRARYISKNIRCVVCQNQSIDDSTAQLAKDLRILIRKKISEGKSDKEIYLFLTNRYGEFILLNPLFRGNTMFLWIFPIILFLIGFLVILSHHKKSNNIK